jgi:hypothetical protein
MSVAIKPKVLMKKNILSGYEKSSGVIVVIKDGSTLAIEPQGKKIF